jgi:hypothetical protein
MTTWETITSLGLLMASLSMLALLVINFLLAVAPEMSLPILLPVTTLGVSFTVLITGIVREFLVGYTQEQRRKVVSAARSARAKSRARPGAATAATTPPIKLESGS